MIEHEKQAQMLELVEHLASVSSADIAEGFGKLTKMQRSFAVAYVLLGGDATKAAEAAGYDQPHVAGTRVRLNPKVAELIRVLALADAGSTLPIAIATLADIARDQTVKPETRRNAALDLARIAQAMPKAGPAVAVQVNTGDSAKAGAPSIVIQNVWDARADRLSGIAAPMLDSIEGTARATADDDDGEG